VSKSIPDPNEDAANAGLESCGSSPSDRIADGDADPQEPKQDLEDHAATESRTSIEVRNSHGQDEDAGEPDSDGADVRMAQVLSGSSNNADLRRKLQGEHTEEASDMLSRLNALDFVQQVVGGHNELPDRIGGYDIKGLLGRGGMGIVYLGWQQELEREVALKVLSHNYTADPTMRKRFRAEARATAALHHRHIVPIYDYGESHGMLFFAMERVNGLSLDKHIQSASRVDKKPLEMLDAARRFAGVADALGLAHRRRLLHRDVKPGNILVGDAKALDHASMQLTSKGGGFLGTLHYASPEQALGGELTPASDLYSLGVTMFEAVTGHLPLAGKTTEALLQSILHGTPSRLRDYLPKPPRDFEAVLDKLLARDADDRYQDGEALSRDLLRIADGEPVHIRRLPLHVRLWRRARKNPVLASALLAVFILVLSTGMLAGVLNRERGKGRISDYQQSLVAIAKAVAADPGPETGPGPLLQTLTGVALAPAEPNATIVALLEGAHAKMPDDTQAEEMLRAYVEDPLPNATAYLRAGRGFEALQQYDIAINKAKQAQSSGDLAVELALYQLYLARGIAKLTASVARANDAQIDLALASYLRPQAVFPLAVLDVLNLVQSPDVVKPVQQLQARLADAAPAYIRAFGLLLWAASGHRPHMASNLMSFSLDYSRRRVLHEFARQLLGEDLVGCVRHGEPSGLAASFAGECREAIRRLADPAALANLVEQRGRDIAMSAHPEAQLQGWRHLLQLLSEPRQRGPILDEEQRPLAPTMQLAAWHALVALQPSSTEANLWLGRFKEFHNLYPGLPGIVEVAARMHSLANSDEAIVWADRWVVDADGDPAALLCRMRVLLQLDRIPEATDDATVAVQNSFNKQQVLERILNLVVAAAKRAEAGAIEDLQLMAGRFQQVIRAGVSQHGGR
jgi:predicted Ser/Thr protein kinase/tetratricopeptide (TPR) repeat protein